MKKYAPAGFTIVETVLLVAVVIIVGLIGWYIWHRHDQNSDISSYADCVKAGYPIQETYPSACKAKSKSFKNPNDQLGGICVVGAGGPCNANSLGIKKWRLQLGLTSKIGDAYYEFEQNEPDTLFLSTKNLKELAKKISCSYGLRGVEYQRSQNPNDNNNPKKESIKIGEYYYFEPLRILPACAIQTSPESQRAGDILQALKQSFAQSTSY